MLFSAICSLKTSVARVMTSTAALTLATCLLDRYYPDFGSNKAERLRFVLPYLGSQQRGTLERLLAADPSARGIKVKYNEYDWTINAAEE